MPKYAVGDAVEKDANEKGVVGCNLHYRRRGAEILMESDGALQFVLENRLAARQTEH